MVDASAAAAERVTALQAAHPDWRVWRSRSGAMWNATRRRYLSMQELYGGLASTLLCEGPQELAQCLDEQAQRERVLVARW
ncbi:hypothetical protein [Actinomadura hibisca]|uniref:hypothetical protein n=1 Tax=Actinomadura hibisca TaxID=68565 RepID=UPI00082F64DD|nr:hypothetical protein [Actinomadura hibisca]